MPKVNGFEVILNIERRALSDKQRAAWQVFWTEVISEAKREVKTIPKNEVAAEN